MKNPVAFIPQACLPPAYIFIILSLRNSDWIVEAIALFPQQTTLFELSKTPHENSDPDEIDKNCDDPFDGSLKSPLQQVTFFVLFIMPQILSPPIVTDVNTFELLKYSRLGTKLVFQKRSENPPERTAVKPSKPPAMKSKETLGEIGVGIDWLSFQHWIVCIGWLAIMPQIVAELP